MGEAHGQNRRQRAEVVGLAGLLLTLVFVFLTLRLLRDVVPPEVKGVAFVMVQLPSQRDVGSTPTMQVHLTAFVPGDPLSPLLPHYSVSACGSGRVNFALILTGDAQLEQISSLANSPPISIVKRTGPVQVVEARVDLIPCIGTPGPNSSYAGSGFDVAGYWAKSFYRSASGVGAFAFPQVGDAGIHTPKSVDWGTGYWMTPPLLEAVVQGDQLGPNDRLDVAKPDTTSGQASLSWSERDFLSPVARWTNLATERRSQNLIVVYSILIGVGASLLGSALQSVIEGAAIRKWRLPRTIARRWRRLGRGRRK